MAGVRVNERECDRESSFLLHSALARREAGAVFIALSTILLGARPAHTDTYEVECSKSSYSW
jgi:hypothetical protein